MSVYSDENRRAYRAAAFDYMREHLPAFPCGFEEPRLVGPDEPNETLPPEWRAEDIELRRKHFGNAPAVYLESHLLTPDEARGFARRLLELADEAER